MSIRAINVTILLRRVRKRVAGWCIARHEPTDHQRERLVNKLKGLRRIATRYEKRAVHYLGMVAICSLVVIVPIGRTLTWTSPHSAFARMSASQQGITL
jgi:4-hydroxybenzoate polyprenyltransferase